MLNKSKFTADTIGAHIRPWRRAGNTTRQANYAIDKLLDGETVYVLDHHGDKKSSRRLLDIIKARLRAEHGIDSMLLDLKYHGQGYIVKIKTVLHF